MAVDRIAYIKEKYSLIDYARNECGLPIRKDGDRCKSFAPGSKNPTAVIFSNDHWHDFKTGLNGDVIDLCAILKHNGDKGEAIRELAGEYGYNPDWKEKTQKRNNLVAYWHEQLRESDRLYLYRRGIKKATVDRLLLGYNEKEDRLIIPYWKNGYVAYYIGRDRSGKPDASKYKKAFLDGYNENIPWGLHTFESQHRSLVEQNIRHKKIITDTPEIITEAMIKNTPSVIKNSEAIQSEKTEMRNSDDKLKIINEVVIIAEGAFDAMSFEQEGFRVLSPISGYFSKDAKKQVISIVKNSEKVFVCFDSDKAGQSFTVDMCKTLFTHRCNFVCGQLPEGYKDVSEYYEANGDLFDLVENAVPGIEVLAKQITDKNEFKKFMYEAARFVENSDLLELCDNVEQFSANWVNAVYKQAIKPPVDKVIIDEILKNYEMKYIENDGFFEYAGGVWVKRPDNFILGYFSNLLGRHTSGSKLSSLERVLKAHITSEEIFNRKPVLVFRNHTLNLETGQTQEHSSADMSTVQLNYDYDPQAKCPRWEKFISEIMINRVNPMLLLQEMVGYIFFTDLSLQKSFVLKGDGSNGKSVFLKVITALFNDKNVSNVEMSSLNEPFQRILLKDSLVNISTETNTDIKGAETVFKQIVTGDKITGCFKNKDFVSFRPRCVCIMACNNFMKVNDKTKGFSRRLIFIDFPQIFEGKNADKDIEKKLLQELPGIFNWAYEGYKRLKKQREFTPTLENNAMLEEFLEASNPVIVFINEKLRGVNTDISRDEMYSMYVNWARTNGYNIPNKTNFSRNFIVTARQRISGFAEKKVRGERIFIIRDLGTKEDFFDDDKYEQEA
ncbi:MAG: toprim domain-containing protein [Synergistaceae bacterium]|nr:toprim domain-containing protein [Synergistaceae bacterium]